MNPRYKTPLSRFWFLERPGFRRFMAREATAIFLAGYLVFLLVWFRRLGQGPEAFAGMMEALRSPGWVFLHVLALLAALCHSITWFNLTPKIMPMYIGEDRVPDMWAALLMGYLPWAGVSAVIIWGVLRTGAGS